ncbi:MAG: glycosyltransferase [Candidatus Hodarchaeota archaeon]
MTKGHYAMKLAVLDTIPIWYDGNQYFAQHVFYEWINKFSIYFKKLIIFAPVLQENRENICENIYKYQIDTKDIDIIWLPFHKNTWDYVRKIPFVFPKTLKLFKSSLPLFNIAWIIMPNFLNLLFYIFLKIYKKNVFIYIRSDIEGEIKNREYHLLTKLLAISCAKAFNHIIKLISKHNLTFVVGSNLYQKYSSSASSVFEIKDSLLHKENIVSFTQIKNKSLNNKIKILYVGRLTEEKGIKYLIRALPILHAYIKHPVELIIVGFGRAEAKLKNEASRLHKNCKVRFLGFIPFSEQLLQIYSNADFFILPSLTEGIPKTLFEAMARGLPIIATRVGGIPDVIHHLKNGILVEPRNPNALVLAIINLINNKKLRDRLIYNGLKESIKYTFTVQREKMMNVIRNHFHYL